MYILNSSNGFNNKRYLLTRCYDALYYFVTVSSRFVNQILFTLPSVHGDFKTYCLEILCSRVEHIPKLFTELKERGLKEMLSQR